MRKLGRSGIEVSDLGMGCWGIGGPFFLDNGRVGGYGQADEDESIKTVEKAIDLGINFFDTADVYGTGQSEIILGQVLPEYRDDVVIATKFGTTFNPEKNQILGNEGNPEYIRQALEKSLQRLQTDYIDVYQFHVGEYDINQAEATRNELEKLVEEGLIRTYGWSTDHVDRASIFAEAPNCSVVQYRYNLTIYNNVMLEMVNKQNLGSIIKSPLGSGLLTGKYDTETKRDEDHMLSHYDLTADRVKTLFQKLDDFREFLVEDGRTLPQAAISYLWSIDDSMIPIPGAKTVDQIVENAGAMNFGKFSDEEMKAIDEIFGERRLDYHKFLMEQDN